MVNRGTLARSSAVDAVRVLAMVAIIAGHVWPEEHWVRPTLYSWHVGIFFFLSGWFWTTGRPVTREVRTRWLTLLLPYLAWGVIVALIWWPIHFARGDLAVREVLRAAWGGQYLPDPFWAFWFAPALFVATVAYRFLERFGRPVQWAVAVLLFVAAVYVPHKPAHLLPVSVGAGLMAVVWVAAGQQIAEGTRRLAARSSAVLGALLLVGGLAVIVGDWDDLTMDMKLLDVGPTMLGVAVSIVIAAGLTLVAAALPAVLVPAWFTTLAEASLVVMFVHVPLIFAFGVRGDPSRLGFVAVVAASWAVGLVLLRLPHTSWLTGQRRTAAGLTPSREDAEGQLQTRAGR